MSQSFNTNHNTLQINDECASSHEHEYNDQDINIR